MKPVSETIAGRNQLQWVVLLLAITVLLPTVCLLWFMSRAAKNERLAVRQKLLEIYQGQLELLSDQIDRQWEQRIAALDLAGQAGKSPAELFADLATGSQPGLPCCTAALVYDSNGQLLYPVVRKDSDTAETAGERFEQAWQLEFVQNDFAAAAEQYNHIAAMNADNYIGGLASLATIRCLRQAGCLNEAIDSCRKFAYATTERAAAVIPLVVQARVLLVTMQADANMPVESEDVSRLVKSAAYYSAASGAEYLPMSSDTRIFLLSRTLQLLGDARRAKQYSAEAETAKKPLAAEQLAASILQQLPRPAAFKPLSDQDKQDLLVSLRRILDAVETSDWAGRLQVDTSAARQLLAAAEDTQQPQPPTTHLFSQWAEDTIYKTTEPADLFAFLHRTSDKVILLVQTSDNMAADFAVIDDQLKKPGLSFRVIDSTGTVVVGMTQSQETAFLQAGLGAHLPGWRIELFSTEANAFEKAASRQIAISVWTGALVIVLIVAAGAAAAQVITKQMRLNKMKNDFIATVSHELKTPLSSMRVLVDTLLEGNIKNPGQADEYLRMVSKENERLSRMIENFLTFSRMERNKQAFTIVPTSARTIAEDAAEAVKTKFAAGDTEFVAQIDENLPKIDADHDAMVTVLVNLLDNAFKYTYEQKKISLKVYAEDGRAICFAVSDNGVGLARRHVKKIFERFYQVDRTLSRRAEGCGLGLSIVKFIVDAHKGTISVESRPGKGSTFTVKLPPADSPSR